ncbi:RNA-binding protein Nova-2-like [Artemia franciscana]
MYNGKRKFDETRDDTGKKINWTDIPLGDGIVFAKILIPSPVAGFVIGKGGETIEKLQKELGIRIRLSKSTDVYPGTNDRVCIMKGTVERLTEFIRTYYMDKVVFLESRENKQLRMDQQFHRYELKMIVPVETVGRLIGNAGATVKELIKTTKAFIQVSQRPPPNIHLPERVMKIAGDYEPIVAAVKEVFTKFKDDANHADYTFVSYANAEYVPNAYPAGPAVAQGNAQGGEEAGPDPYGMAGGQMGAKMAPAQGYGAAASMLGGDGDGVERLLIAHDQTPVEPEALRSYMARFSQQLQTLGCPAHSIQEIAYAIETLSKYHLLSLTGGKKSSPSWTAPGQSIGYSSIYGTPKTPGVSSLMGQKPPGSKW